MAASLTVCQSQLSSVATLVHAASPPSDLFGDPSSGSVCHGQTRRADAIVLLGPAAVGAVWIRTPPSPLVPQQPLALAETGQVHQCHDPSVLQLGDDAARRTPRARRPALDLDDEHGLTVF